MEEAQFEEMNNMIKKEESIWLITVDEPLIVIKLFEICYEIESAGKEKEVFIKKRVVLDKELAGLPSSKVFFIDKNHVYTDKEWQEYFRCVRSML